MKPSNEIQLNASQTTHLLNSLLVPSPNQPTESTEEQISDKSDYSSSNI